MPFDHYDRRMHRPDRPASVAIYATGYLAIHRAAYCGLGEPRYVHLSFDAVRGLIGIEPVLERTLASYTLTLIDRPGVGAIVGMKAFLSFLGIDRSVTRRYHAAFDAARLVIDPSQPEHLPIDMERFQGGSFQVFDERRNGHPGDVTASIVTSGSISLSLAAHDRLGRPKYVEVYYDPLSRKIAIEAVAEATGSSYRLTVQKHSIVFKCKGFLDYCKIDAPTRRRYAAAMEKGKLVVNLRAPSVRAVRRAGVGGIVKPNTPQPLLRIISARAEAS